jgi:hypothetical protein
VVQAGRSQSCFVTFARRAAIEELVLHLLQRTATAGEQDQRHGRRGLPG